MSKQGLIITVIVIVMIMFAPLVLADGLSQFFHGVGVIFSRWTSK